MKLDAFINMCKIANSPKEYADSLILIFTDLAQVVGPFFGEEDQLDAYAMAENTGRPYKFTTWNHKGE